MQKKKCISARVVESRAWRNRLLPHNSIVVVVECIRRRERERERPDLCVCIYIHTRLLSKQEARDSSESRILIGEFAWLMSAYTHEEKEKSLNIYIYRSTSSSLLRSSRVNVRRALYE